MKIDIIKTSFVAGEFGKSLFGRTDIAQYQYACETVENFLVRPYGSLISTPGTRYIAEVKSSGTARLIKFIFSRSDSYIIEMGENYFRFFTDQGSVISSGTTVLEIAHSYSTTQIWDVQYAQINDVIYLSHKSHRTKKLTRVAANDWTFTDFDFLGGPFLDDNTTAITITPSATAGSITLTLSATNSTTYFRTGATTHIGSYWRVGASRTDATTGLTVQPYVKITAFTSSTIAVGTVMEEVVAAATDNWAEGAWSSVRGYPARITFHEKRLCFARTDAEPQKVWGSKSYIYDDFAVGSEDDDALNLALASNESNELQWLLSGKVLAAGSYGGEFIISATNGGPLTPTSVQVSRTSSWGSEAIVPKKIGNFLYLVQRFGKKLREMFYQWDIDSYKCVDKTIMSPHILGDGIKDMAYQENPDTILWCVRTDGTIATLTREVDQEVQGWSRQTTDGLYESVASIPNRTNAYDECWVIVNRTIGGVAKRYIEVFEDINPPDRQDHCLYLHSALTYDAYTAPATATSISLTLGTASTVIITSSVIAFTIASDIGQRIRAIDTDGVTLGECLITSVASTRIVHGTVTKSFSTIANVVTTASTLNYASGYWGLSVDTITGLDHLEGETLKVLADGGIDAPDEVVSNGSITLNYDYFVVNAGLPYTQKLKTLPIEAGSSRGTAQGKVQRIYEVGFKVNNSYKGFTTGGETAYLEKVSTRDPSTLMGTPELLYTGIIPNISFRDDWKYGSVVLVENPDPLPLELLNIIACLSTEDK
jgi:hypothetical protein